MKYIHKKKKIFRYLKRKFKKNIDFGDWHIKERACLLFFLKYMLKEIFYISINKENIKHIESIYLYKVNENHSSIVETVYKEERTDIRHVNQINTISK